MTRNLYYTAIATIFVSICVFFLGEKNKSENNNAIKILATLSLAIVELDKSDKLFEFNEWSSPKKEVIIITNRINIQGVAQLNKINNNTLIPKNTEIIVARDIQSESLEQEQEKVIAIVKTGSKNFAFLTNKRRISYGLLSNELKESLKSSKWYQVDMPTPP